MKHFITAFFWLCWNGLLGLAPLLIFLFLRQARQSAEITEIATEEYLNLIKDLVMLFFCAALIGGLCLDFAVGKKKYSVRTYFAMGAFALIPVALAFILYLPMVFTHFRGVRIERITNLQWWLLLLTIIFCLFTKTVLLVNENKKGQ